MKTWAWRCVGSLQLLAGLGCTSLGEGDADERVELVAERAVVWDVSRDQIKRESDREFAGWTPVRDGFVGVAGGRFLGLSRFSFGDVWKVELGGRPVGAPVFGLDQIWLALANRTVVGYDLRTGAQLGGIYSVPDVPAGRMILDDSGRLLFVSGRDQVVCVDTSDAGRDWVWGVRSGRSTPVLVTGVAPQIDGGALVAVLSDGSAVRLTLAGGQLLGQAKLAQALGEESSTQFRSFVVLGPLGRSEFIGARADGAVLRLKVLTTFGGQPQGLELQPVEGHRSWSKGVQWLAGTLVDQRLVLCGESGQVISYNVSSGQVEWQLQLAQAGIHIDGSGRYLVVSTAGGAIELLDSFRGRRLAQRQIEALVYAPVWFRDDGFLLTSQFGTLLEFGVVRRERHR